MGKTYIKASTYNVGRMVDKFFGNFTIVFKKIIRNGRKIAIYELLIFAISL